VTDGRFDDLAKSLAAPVSRFGALKIFGAAAVAALVPTARASAVARANCPPYQGVCRPDSNIPGRTLCVHPEATTCFPNCCDPMFPVCCVDQDPHPTDPNTASWCCPQGEKCGNRSAFERECIPVCHWDDPLSGAQQQPYDPASECCTSRGVQPKSQGFSLQACADTLREKPGYKPKVNGCGTDRIKLPDTLRCGRRKLTIRNLCDNHDRCYGTCGKAKDQCDRALIRAFEEACESRYAKQSRCRENCVDLAYTASLLLRTHDEPERAYKQAQQEACECC
jgi:hypothetical protein